MKIYKSILTLVFFSALFIFQSCKPECERNPDNPECLGEEELITTLQVHVYDSATNAVVGLYQFKDADGNGMPEVFDTIKLPLNTTCRVALKFLNESVSPAEDITPEIEGEKDEHLIVFQSNGVSVAFTYADQDNNALPVGLSTYWKANTLGTGTIQLKLRHQPGVKDGTENPGDTDMEVIFPVLVQ